MKAGGGAFVIILGIIMLWVAASNKIGCFKAFGDCMAGNTMFGSGAAPQTGGSIDPNAGAGGSWLSFLGDLFGAGTQTSGGPGSSAGAPSDPGTSDPFNPGQTGNPLSVRRRSQVRGAIA